MFVYLSKFLPTLFYPITLTCLLLLLAMFLKNRRTANKLLLFTFCMLMITGNEFPGAYLTRQLETAYPPFDGKQKAGAIVVLGGGTISKAWPRQTVEMNGAGDRIFYGASLYNQGCSELMIVGGSYIDWLDGQSGESGTISSPASEMAEFATLLGVPEANIIIQDLSVNTHEEAVEDAKILKEKNISEIILVTSATHMRRSVALFEKQGLKVIPAPTDYSYSDQQWQEYTQINWAAFYKYILPTESNIRSLENALKEYVGYFVYQIRGWL